MEGYSNYMYDQIKNDISQEYYLKNYPNNGQRFVAWYLRNIHNLNTFETKACIIDGRDDKQIDAVYVDDQAQIVYIIQGKFYQGTIDSEPLREVIASWIQIKDLTRLQESANYKLRQKINEISQAFEDDYEVCFELVTTANLTDAAKKDLDAFNNELSESQTLNANIVLVDGDTIQARYNEALNKNRPVSFHSKCKVWGQRTDTVQQFKEPSQRSVPRIF